MSHAISLALINASLPVLGNLPLYGNLLLAQIVAIRFSLLYPLALVVTQGILLNFQYNWSIIDWMKANAVGFIGSIVAMTGILSAFILIAPADNYESMTGNLLLLSMMIPIAIAQLWVLRHRLQQTWLWGLGVVIGFGMVSLESLLVPFYRTLGLDVTIINVSFG
ncbi:MAG: hypothetical protein AAFV93_07630 [Chloroflexota bacterium]